MGTVLVKILKSKGGRGGLTRELNFSKDKQRCCGHWSSTAFPKIFESPTSNIDKASGSSIVRADNCSVIFISFLWNDENLLEIITCKKFVESRYSSYPRKSVITFSTPYSRRDSLLNKVSWSRDIAYKQIADMNANYVQAQYASSTVVFDGYVLSSTTKDSCQNQILK
ncbi:hypothetical protein ElyMa_000397700 [Elysia marginata]|uniref:Uncharacterized protein n=1 Tax=Elysia marginata TaxID=1093978 RepID=A0AAV4FJE4_9GAST|nr:hypothetical protein ElyMa_000397700 [Elysia marginata]